jgi:KipI family sensor histidine kinase inhibitor
MHAPYIRNAGISGLLVTFADQLSDEANRAALAFRDAVELNTIDGVTETSNSLVSTLVLFDPARLSRNSLSEKLNALLDSQDWLSSSPRTASRLWRVKACFEAEHAPHLSEVASLAGLTVESAVNEVLATRLRVMTIGFAPGQPYLGTLPPNWDFPRLNSITPQVPAGSLVVALRQLIIFTNNSPTGWRQIGQTAFKNFDAGSNTPFKLRTGDEIEFVRVNGDAIARCLRDPSRAEAADLVVV